MQTKWTYFPPVFARRLCGLFGISHHRATKVTQTPRKYQKKESAGGLNMKVSDFDINITNYYQGIDFGKMYV